LHATAGSIADAAVSPVGRLLVLVVLGGLGACRGRDGLPPEMENETVVAEVLPPLPARAVTRPGRSTAVAADASPGRGLRDRVHRLGGGSDAALHDKLRELGYIE
jgi:hypothetical protein